VHLFFTAAGSWPIHQWPQVDSQTDTFVNCDSVLKLHKISRRWNSHRYSWKSLCCTWLTDLRYWLIALCYSCWIVKQSLDDVALCWWPTAQRCTVKRRWVAQLFLCHSSECLEWTLENIISGLSHDQSTWLNNSAAQLTNSTHLSVVHNSYTWFKSFGL